MGNTLLNIIVHKKPKKKVRKEEITVSMLHFTVSACGVMKCSTKKCNNGNYVDE